MSPNISLAKIELWRQLKMLLFQHFISSLTPIMIFFSMTKYRKIPYPWVVPGYYQLWKSYTLWDYTLVEISTWQAAASSHLMDILNYICRYLSNCGTNKPLVDNFGLFAGDYVGRGEGVSMGFQFSEPAVLWRKNSKTTRKILSTHQRIITYYLYSPFSIS